MISGSRVSFQSGDCTKLIPDNRSAANVSQVRTLRL